MIPKTLLADLTIPDFGPGGLDSLGFLDITLCLKEFLGDLLKYFGEDSLRGNI